MSYSQSAPWEKRRHLGKTQLPDSPGWAKLYHLRGCLEGYLQMASSLVSYLQMAAHPTRPDPRVPTLSSKPSRKKASPESASAWDHKREGFVKGRSNLVSRSGFTKMFLPLQSPGIPSNTYSFLTNGLVKDPRAADRTERYGPFVFACVGLCRGHSTYT